MNGATLVSTLLELGIKNAELPIRSVAYVWGMFHDSLFDPISSPRIIFLSGGRSELLHALFILRFFLNFTPSRRDSGLGHYETLLNEDLTRVFV